MKSFCVYEDKIKKFLSFCAFMLLSNLSAKHISKSPWKKYREREICGVNEIYFFTCFLFLLFPYISNERWVYVREHRGSGRCSRWEMSVEQLWDKRWEAEHWNESLCSSPIAQKKNAAKRSYRIIGNMKKGK